MAWSVLTRIHGVCFTCNVSHNCGCWVFDPGHNCVDRWREWQGGSITMPNLITRDERVGRCGQPPGPGWEGVGGVVRERARGELYPPDTQHVTRGPEGGWGAAAQGTCCLASSFVTHSHCDSGPLLFIKPPISDKEPFSWGPQITRVPSILHMLHMERS